MIHSCVPFYLPCRQRQSHLVQVCFLLKNYLWPPVTVRSQTPRTLSSSLAKLVVPLAASPQYALILLVFLSTLLEFVDEHMSLVS